MLGRSVLHHRSRIGRAIERRLHTDLATGAELFLRIEGEEDESMTVICRFDLRLEFLFLHAIPRSSRKCAINLAHAHRASQDELKREIAQKRASHPAGDGVGGMGSALQIFWRMQKTDSSFTTSEPAPQSKRSAGPLKRSGPRSLRMTPPILVMNFRDRPLDELRV